MRTKLRRILRIERKVSNKLKCKEVYQFNKGWEWNNGVIVRSYSKWLAAEEIGGNVAGKR